jgi:hypothetical protein
MVLSPPIHVCVVKGIDRAGVAQKLVLLLELNSVVSC